MSYDMYEMYENALIGSIVGYLVVIIGWIILSFVLASAAQKRGRSYGLFLALGLLCSPIIGFIILLVMSENETK